MTKSIRRVLGLAFDGKPVYEPVNSVSSLTFAATGGAKTTGVAVPAIQAMMADPERAIFINDMKNGEIAAQIGAMCKEHGRKFGCVDEFTVLGTDHPFRIRVNPFSSIVRAHHRGDPDLAFLIETMTHTFIPEVANDQKNKFFRDEPRELIDLATRILLRHNPALVTPGGVHGLLNDPRTWTGALGIAAEEAEPVTRGMARHVLAMRENNKEHYGQHMRAALTALRIFAEGPLHEAGLDADVTHEELIRDHWIVCFVNPTRHVDRLGPFFAQHFTALMDVQLSGAIGKADYVLDEYCNAPLHIALKRLTVFRAFGARAHFIAQSRKDSVRQYGEKETDALEENCVVKQYLKFSNYEEAERVSRAMGEEETITAGLNLSSKDIEIAHALNKGRQRVFTAGELMSLPVDEQIIHIAGLGFIHCRKISQNQIAPTCFDLGDNPLEGGRLEPDPKVTLPTSKGGQS